MPPSPFVTNFFISIVALVAATFLVATYRAGQAIHEPAKVSWLWTLIGASVLGAVVGVASWMGAHGVLRNWSAFPPPTMGLVLLVTVITITLAFGPFGGRLAGTLPLWGLVGFQGFRILVEIALLLLHREGALPRQMTMEGMNFDVVSGISALLLGGLLWRRSVPFAVVLGWNVLGLLLLLTIVVISVLSMPTPLRAFHTEPANILVADGPFVLLPTVLVQAALFGHLLVFRRLGRDRRRTART